MLVRFGSMDEEARVRERYLRHDGGGNGRVRGYCLQVLLLSAMAGLYKRVSSYGCCVRSIVILGGGVRG